jgi:hypothetical protein
MSSSPPEGRAKGAAARAKSLTPERRKEIARRAAAARREIASLPKATHGSAEHPLRIGDVEIPCYVLDDGTRVLSQRGVVAGLGMKRGTAGGEGGDRLTRFLGGKGISAFVNKDLAAVIASPIKFRSPGGIAFGYPATILADICDAVLAARASGALQKQQEHIANQAEVLVRGFARVGIIALVDEATGYQKDRQKDALAKILEAFVAKELQPYLKTFPSDYYEQLFRLYKLPYPPAGNRSWRPSFFGSITNEVVYSRLAPDLLPELKKAASKAERKAKLHQWLTTDIGHPKLREHLSSIVTIMKLSRSPEEFKAHVNAIHPRYGDTGQLDFGGSEGQSPRE